ncbi:hypothetical protein CcaverHIS631_0408190 [Cutaneotrichosporon cavernicola]|nr:hypothetical protein CcaverHIS631_0408190 [Cutaneotrichosporon cavernicola]BEJ07552.1 hypothetical protein CcaverHIS641_0408210 [Cutaneotrichosporon cavernicola]
MSTRAIVKSVLSGDTVIVRPKEAPARGQATKERVLHLAGTTAPRVGTASRDDEPFAFPAREFLRSHLVGKEVAFTVTHTLPSGGEFATVLSAPPGPGKPPQDVATLVVENGWAKARDNAPEALKEAEGRAQAENRGLWAAQPDQLTVAFSMPSDPHAFIAEHAGEIDAIVEQVRDGTQLRVRLMLDENHHQIINLVIAGAKSPRASITRDGELQAAEPWGEEAKFFTEARILQRHIKVRLLSAPVSLNSAPFQTTEGGGLPAPVQGASFIIGQAIHPNGNIAEFLSSAGLAKVIDWHAGILAPYGGLEKLRAAEKSAKERRVGLWEGYGATKAANGAGAAVASSTTKGQSFEATVVRIWGPDQLSIVAKGDSPTKDRRVQLASVRGPRGADAKNSYYAAEAKEFLRKRLVGKVVNVHIDYVKPKDGEYEERECVTIKYGGNQNNVSEQLIEKGLATVLRHRRDDEDRSMEYDKLVLAEQAAAAETKGLHSPKEVSLPRIVDASENNSRAAQFLPSWKRHGKHNAVVDFVSAGSRFKLLLPKESAKITFVLAGIRAPRTARNPNEKSEPYGNEAHRFASRALQRDVEVTFDSTDKQGGFIGGMFIGNNNVAVDLVRNGLATVHEPSARNLPFGGELLAAEEAAKNERKNIWADFDDEQEVAPTVDTGSALPPQYLDVCVSSVRESDPFTFSYQELDETNMAALERLMSDFGLHHRNQSNAAPAGWTPKTGELVSAKFSEDNTWYRARVKRASGMKKEAHVYFIDYGNEETMPFSRIRPLDQKFKNLPGQAKEARLSFVKLPPRDSEYGGEAWRRFGDLTIGRKLVANVDQREGNLVHLRLIDPTDPNSAEDPLACVNADLVREGLAALDKGLRYLGAYPQIVKKIQQAAEGAKIDRLGMFELGDVSED